MKYIPDFSLKIIEEDKFSESIKIIEEELERVKVCGNFKAFDGINIYYEYFLAENSRASVVIVHGLSEFTKKFYEFIYYLLNQGLNVFIYDQRCHGLSERLTDNIDLLHVDNFNDYVEDLSQFIDEVVLKTEDKPLYLYSNSMGGAISVLYLSRNPNKIERAVLAVPMFEPIVDYVPMPIARGGVSVGRLIYGSKTKFFLTKDFNPNVQYRIEHGASRARFEHNMELRRGNPNYRSTPMSFGWIHNSLTVRRKIFKPKVINSIKTPILMLSADNDVMVNNKLQYKFAEKCRNCRLEKIKNSTHSILVNDIDTMAKIMKLTLNFYSE